MSRDWHQYQFVHEFSVEEAFHELDLEIESAAASCPEDASGQLVRLVVEAKREVLHRLRNKLEDAQKTLHQVLDDYGVWEKVRGEE